MRTYVFHIYISGEIIEAPQNVTYCCCNTTPLPIELTCKVSGVAAWIINGTRYALDQINKTLQGGHDRNGTNVLIYTPVDNMGYVCVSQERNGQDIRSNPAYITVIGMEVYTLIATT